jgi:hypothetical protein
MSLSLSGSEHKTGTELPEHNIFYIIYTIAAYYFDSTPGIRKEGSLCRTI